jgi:hypothetical protein
MTSIEAIIIFLIVILLSVFCYLMGRASVIRELKDEARKYE